MPFVFTQEPRLPVQPEILQPPDTTTAHTCTSSFPYNTLNTNRVRTCHLPGVCHLTCLCKIPESFWRPFSSRSSTQRCALSWQQAFPWCVQRVAGACVGVYRLMRASVISTYQLDERGRHDNTEDVNLVQVRRKIIIRDDPECASG